MYAPSREGEQGPLKMALYGISKIYGGAQVVRRECYRRGWRRSFRLPCKVVSVGNLAVGGTGKTPMTAYLARAFEQMGQRVVVISRGYKGGGGRTSRVVSDGHQVLMTAPQSGDEAQLLARQLKTIPVLIGKDRYQAGMDAVAQFQPDVIILDDGFQHLRLSRDLDLVLLDAAAPFGNGHLLPRGILREPVSALAAADGVVFTRAVPDQSANVEHLDFLHPEMAVFRSTHKPYHFIQKRGRSATQGNMIYPDVSHDLSLAGECLQWPLFQVSPAMMIFSASCRITALKSSPAALLPTIIHIPIWSSIGLQLKLRQPLLISWSRPKKIICACRLPLSGPWISWWWVWKLISIGRIKPSALFFKPASSFSAKRTFLDSAKSLCFALVNTFVMPVTWNGPGSDAWDYGRHRY